MTLIPKEETAEKEKEKEEKEGRVGSRKAG